jgi:hypothetical protein
MVNNVDFISGIKLNFSKPAYSDGRDHGRYRLSLFATDNQGSKLKSY